MKIAIAQINPTVGDLAGNTQRILQVAQQAAAMGANLLLTPETFFMWLSSSRSINAT